MAEQVFELTNYGNMIEIFLTLIIILGLSVLAVFGLVKLFLLWLKLRGREKKSLDSVLLQIAVPRGNEIKIDAAEQMFASLYSIKKSRKSPTTQKKRIRCSSKPA